MMLGTDVSALSTTAATAAAQGLSIVVPLYNEAAGLAHLHERLDDLARTLGQRYRLACEVVYVDDGYDVVYTAKAHRESEPWLRRFGVKVFYSLINWGARQKIPQDAGDFRLLSPRAAAALRQLPERNRFFKGLASWIGFRQIRVDYEPAARTHGATTFSAARLVGLSIEGLTSFSVAPLRFASLLGVLLASVAFLFGLSILWETWTTGKSVPGYPSLVVGLMTIGGVQLIMIGIVGEYIGKILSELKARPIYFVAEHSVKRIEAETGASASERTAAE